MCSQTVPLRSSLTHSMLDIAVYAYLPEPSKSFQPVVFLK